MPVIALATTISWHKFHNSTLCLTASFSQMNVTSLTLNINFLNRELVELTPSASIKSLLINAGDSCGKYQNWSKMRLAYIQIMALVSHLFPIRKVVPLFGNPSYLFPYCQLVCHVLSEITAIYTAGRQWTYNCEAGDTVNRFGD